MTDSDPTNQFDYVLSRLEPETLFQSISIMAVTLIEGQGKRIDPKKMEAVATNALRASINAHRKALKEAEESEESETD
jgi:hypothetical protein